MNANLSSRPARAHPQCSGWGLTISVSPPLKGSPTRPARLAIRPARLPSSPGPPDPRHSAWPPGPARPPGLSNRSGRVWDWLEFGTMYFQRNLVQSSLTDNTSMGGSMSSRCARARRGVVNQTSWTGQLRYHTLSALAHVELGRTREHPDRHSLFGAFEMKAWTEHACQSKVLFSCLQSTALF